MHVAGRPPAEISQGRTDPAPPRANDAAPPAGPGRGGAASVGLASGAEGTAVIAASAALSAERELTQTSAPSAADQVHIQPLDIKGAMHILIAEVQAELLLPDQQLSAEGQASGAGPFLGEGSPVEGVLLGEVLRPGAALFTGGGLPSVAGTLSAEGSPPSAGLPSGLRLLVSDGPYAAPWPVMIPGSTSAVSAVAVSQALVLEFLQALPAAELHEPAAWLVAVYRIETAVQVALDKGLATVATWHDVAPPVVDAAHTVRTLVFDALSDDPPNPLWLRPEWLGLAPRMQRFRRRRRCVRRRMSDPDSTPARWDDFPGLDDNESDQPGHLA